MKGSSYRPAALLPGLQPGFPGPRALPRPAAQEEAWARHSLPCGDLAGPKRDPSGHQEFATYISSPVISTPAY